MFDKIVNNFGLITDADMKRLSISGNGNAGFFGKKRKTDDDSLDTFKELTNTIDDIIEAIPNITIPSTIVGKSRYEGLKEIFSLYKKQNMSKVFLLSCTMVNLIARHSGAKEVSKIAEGLIALAIKERDNYDEVTVSTKVPQKDKDGKRVKEEKDGKKVTVYEEIQKEIKKDLPSRLHARRQMLKVFYGATSVPTALAGRKKNTTLKSKRFIEKSIQKDFYSTAFEVCVCTRHLPITRHDDRKLFNTGKNQFRIFQSTFCTRKYRFLPAGKSFI